MQIEEGEAEIELEASFEGLNLGLVSERLDQDLGAWRTRHSGKVLAIAAASSLQVDGQDLAASALGDLKWSWRWKSRPGQVVCFERSVAIVRSDSEAFDPGPLAREKLGVRAQTGWRGAMAAHEAAWANRWRRSSVEVEGDPAAQQTLRFAIYHLNSAADPGDERVSIGARALTGGDYHGHVFWDTEIYLLPFYILTWPEAARALLMYRFHTLDGARAKAARLGWRGALYAWESADTGEETAPEQVIGPDRQIIPILSRHAGAAHQRGRRLRCLAILASDGGRWFSPRRRRGDRSGDGPLLVQPRQAGGGWPPPYPGRHRTRRISRDYRRQRLHQCHGALEHPARARCGGLIARALARGLDAAVVAPRSREAELKEWRTVAETIATGLDPKTGLFEEFEGYFGLENIDLAAYAGRSVPMDVVLGRDRTQKSQVIKQADVVALLALLPEEFAGASGADNFRYYEPRCDHGSSLSPSMHGLVAARLGQPEMALRYFQQSAAIDLSDGHAGIDGGVHIAALGGNWMVAVLGFAGLSLQTDGISFDPKLPATWRSLAFAIQWRGRSLKIKIDQDRRRLEATLEDGDPMTLGVSGERYNLRRDQTLHASFDQQVAAA